MGEQPSVWMQLRNPRRTPQTGRAAASLPSLRANRDRLAESGRLEFLRELAPPEMHPDSLRPD